MFLHHNEKFFLLLCLIIIPFLLECYLSDLNCNYSDQFLTLRLKSVALIRPTSNFNSLASFSAIDYYDGLKAQIIGKWKLSVCQCYFSFHNSFILGGLWPFYILFKIYNIHNIFIISNISIYRIILYIHSEKAISY